MQFELVNCQVTLAKAAACWNQEVEIAVDIECENNQHRYGRHLALLQISTRTQNWIIDPLEIDDLGPAVEMFESASITKIFHDVGFDFRILLEKLGCKPQSVFDTKHAAQLLGRSKIGLSSLLEEEFGLTIEKKYQRVDWTKRPLSEGMLDYAVQDSAHLLALKDALEKQLAEKGRTEWAKEEFEYLVHGIDYNTPKPNFMNVTHAKSLTDQQRAILKLLFEEREKLAQQIDRPTYYIFNDKRLIELVRRPPKGVGGWRSLRGVHPALKRHAQRFVTAVEQGSTAEPIPWPKGQPRRRFNAEQHELFDKLTIIREKLGEKHNLEPSQILSKDQMTKASDTLSLDHLRPWQKKLIEQELDKE